MKNDEYIGDLNAKSSIPLYYKCRKCKKNVWAHLYNEHIRLCGKKIKQTPLQKIIQPSKIEKPERLVNITVGRTKTRHRKRPPVGR